MTSTVSGTTVTTANLSDGTDTIGVDNVVQGTARAWVNFQGSGTVTINDDFGVSSITDQGTGQYEVAFTTAFANTNYAPTAWGRNTQSGQSWCLVISALSNDDFATTHFDILCRDEGTATRDGNPVCIAVFAAP